MYTVIIEDEVSDFLLSVQKQTSVKVTRLLELLEEFGPSLRMPYSKQVRKNLYELRPRGVQEIRLFYCFIGRRARVVHGFIKKSQRTPKKEIEVAMQRIGLLKTV